MRAILTIAKRELVAYFTSPVAYVFLVIFLLLTGFFTFTAGNFFERGEASLAAFFGWHPWLYLVLVPAVGMRVWAEERRSGTLELLLTMPVAPWQAIVANGTPEELRAMSEIAGAVTLQARGATEERLSELGRVEKVNGAFRIYPKDKSQAAELAKAVVEMVNLHGWKVEGMYSERGELDEVFRRITLPDTVKKS